MSNTSARTLRLLSLLQNHRYWPGAELAERLGVSPRTLRRDVDRLRELGYPVESQRGVDGGYQLAAGASLPPLLLDDEEAVAIVVGLQAAAQSAVAGVSESSVRVLAKVVQVLPARLRRRAEALGAVTVQVPWRSDDADIDAEVLTTIAQAARDTERIEFGYTDRAGEITERLVEPHRLVVLGRRWYLAAYDLARHDWRTFRVDRIRAPHLAGKRFGQREIPGGDAAEYVRRSVGSAASTYRVDAVVHAPAPHVQASTGDWAEVTPIDDTTCRLRMNANSLDWPLVALGGLDAEFTVVEPPELIERLGSWADRFGRAAEAAGAADSRGAR